MTRKKKSPFDHNYLFFFMDVEACLLQLTASPTVIIVITEEAENYVEGSVQCLARKNYLVAVS